MIPIRWEGGRERTEGECIGVLETAGVVESVMSTVFAMSATSPVYSDSGKIVAAQRTDVEAKSRHRTRQKSNPPTLGSAVQLQGCVRHITLFAPKIMVASRNSSAATVGWAFMKARHEKKHTQGGICGRCSVS
jgi:hypothetical protein